MLTASELTAYLLRRRLSSAAQSVVSAVRSSAPSRRVGGGANNVACHYASRKMGVTIQAESHKNELPAVWEWEHDPGTLEFYDQPPRIKLDYLNREGKHVCHLATPDYFLLQEDFTGWVECKTEEWLEAHQAKGGTQYVFDPEQGWRCPAGEDYAASVGLQFAVRSSAATCWAKVCNLEFLADYLDERCPEPAPEAVHRVHAIMLGQAWCVLKDLLESLETSDADTVFKMVADGLLYADLDNDLLAEPERTMIFRDALAAVAYRSYVDSRRRAALPSCRPVPIEPGASLLWDGQPWRILNVGDSDIFLQDSKRVLTTLRRDHLEQLVKEGTVTGLPGTSSAAQEEAERRISNASPDDFQHALMRYHCLFPDRCEGQPPASSERARRKWRALFDRSQEATGSGFLGLLPSIHSRGNRERRLDDGVMGIMNAVIDDLFAQPGERTILACYGEVELRCEEAGLLVPSENTFCAEIKRRKAYDLKVAREGKKAAYPDKEFYWRLEQTTPVHGERPFEIGHIDHTELDLQFVGSRKGEKLAKAWLTVLLDAYTRMVLAWVILFDEPSYRSCMMVIRECIRRHGRIPKNIVVDRGAEFLSIYFDTLLASLETHKKIRPGSKPRFGSVMERFFGVSNEVFVHNLLGNNQALQKPRSMSKSHDPRDLAVWTLPAFAEAFDRFLDKTYSEMEHPALGLSPKASLAIGLAQSGPRAHRLIPYTRDIIIMCLPSTPKGTARVDAGRGVKIGYIYYWTPLFRNPAHAGQSVPVRYDPFDESTAFAWLRDQWVPCRSEYAAVFQGRSEKEIRAATQEIWGRLRRSGERRAINAKLIANALRETTVTEKRLKDTLRNEENHAAMALSVSAAMPGHSAGGEGESAPAAPESAQGIWDNLKLKIFGEFV